MAGEWIKCNLADACCSIDYGLTASASNHDVGPRFLRITDIVSGHIDWNAVPHIAADAETTKKYQLHHGDIVLARTGASTGASAYVKDPPEAVFASYLIRLKAKPEFDSRFLAYYLKSNDFWEFICGVLGDKCAQPNASASTMTKAPLRAPREKKDQQAIAHILGTLDDKIELNRRMNRTLEEMTRAIFKSWFVDFEPVRAKMEGRWKKGETLPGLPAVLWDTFPDKLVDSELGPIPEGWAISTIGDMVQVLGGGTPSTKNPAYWEGGTHPFCTPKDMASLTDPVLLQTERHITDEGLAKVSSGQLPVGTVLLSSRAPIGYLAVAETPVSVNQGIIAMVCDAELPNLFVLHWIEANMDRVLANANGSTFMEISKRNFRPITVVLPKQDILYRFNQIVEPLHKRVVSLLIEIQHLVAIRDALLPKLISGELRVSDAKSIAERCL